MIVTAIVRGGDIGIFLSLNSFFIVAGGTVSTAFIAFHYSKIFELIPVIVNAFKPDDHKPLEYINLMIHLLKKYRTDGRKALENHHEFLDNRFFEQGIRMIVDDYKVEDINDLITKSINSVKERHTQGQAIIRFMGAQAPIFGMAGTLIGLIQMMQNLSDPSMIGPGLAVSLNTTFYVILISYLILGIIVGTLSGTFGVGGGFLMTPLLIFLGIPPAIAVASEANLPIRFIGAGEGIRDLRPFESFEFVEALLSKR